MDKQEPAAWMWDVYSGAGYTSRGIDFFPTDIPFAKHTPLYTAPQSEWVGLTDEEIADVFGDYMDSVDEIEDDVNWGYERLIEAKLKEKNAKEEN